MNKILSFILLIPFITACTRTYRVEGSSSVNSLNGRMLFLKVVRDGNITVIDSAEVVHGLFRMKGRLDSVEMATLYIDNISIMPLVLESGRMHLTISDMDLRASGTPLNDALYSFIRKKNCLELSLRELDEEEAKRVMDGEDYNEVHSQIAVKSDSLIEVINKCVKGFISDNYDNVLGPNVFMMLCASLPYPTMTPQIEDIIEDVPHSFRSNVQVREFLLKAKENKRLIEEHRQAEWNERERKNVNGLEANRAVE